MYLIETRRQELEQRASSLIGIQRLAFQEISIRNPSFYSPELAFYQVLTWLYVFYYEAGRISIPFLMDKFSTYGLDTVGKHRQHYEDVRLLRTYLQHNLNLESSRDLTLRRSSERWFSYTCGSSMPGSSNDWECCLMEILSAAESFLLNTIDCVREIERDQSCESIVSQWSVRIRLYHPKHEFERIVEMVAHDFGQDGLDSVKLTARFYDKWTKALRFLRDDYDFDEEARKLVEQTILSENEALVPVSGLDLMREFGLRPGRQVKDLKERATELYHANPCSKGELICRLREEMGASVTSAR